MKPNFKITDLSCNGKCTKCGECCSNLLPITQSELDTIQEYVIKHKIKPQKARLIMERKLQCPYFNGSKCLIYEVRPLICKAFYCYRKPTFQESIELIKDERIPVDMWKIAEEIEKIKHKNKA